MRETGVPGGGHVCSAQHGAWLATPVRRLVHRPERILRGLIARGETVADIGCGPGFFTLPMARLVGESGSVIAVDLQEGMLEMLRARAEREGLAARIRTHQCSETELGLADAVDFALAFYMVHEVPDVRGLLSQVRAMLKPEGRFLLVEPMFHVSAAAFAKTVEIASAVGMKPIGRPKVALSRAVLFARG